MIGWDGGPTRPADPMGVTVDRRQGHDDSDEELARLQETSNMDALDLAREKDRPRTNTTGIEIAAALATGSLSQSNVSFYENVLLLSQMDLLFIMNLK